MGAGLNDSAASAARDDSDWFVLGFSYDAVVGAWQDWRLARECSTVGELAPGSVLAAAGQGENIIEWFVRRDAAERLDAGGVHWRRFLVRGCARPPADARPVLVRTDGP